jgi:AGCS family alanine or glycine:cation symporter
LLQPIVDLLSILEFKIDEMPLIVLWLIIGSIFFTIRMKFINFRGFKHAIDVTRGVKV